METRQHDLLVIGAGPGGYVAAIRAAQLGLNVGCIEKEASLGGTCLRIGCIPSKALLESSELYWRARHDSSRHGIVCDDLRLDLLKLLARKDQVVNSLTKGVEGLFKKNKITRYQGHARIVGPATLRLENGDQLQELRAPHIIIATGSKPSTLPGVAFDGARIGSSTDALAYGEVPAHLVVIGAGYIGLELGSVWKRLGSKVTVLEYLERILPGMDTEMAGEARKLFEKQGLEFQLGSKVIGARREGTGAVVQCEGREPIPCDRVLMAVGRAPNTEQLGLETVGIAPDKKGRILVSPNFATQAKGFYAIGDVIPGPMLAHKAEEEGMACVEHIVTGHGHVNYDAIPGVVYTHPEIAAVGKTEDELIAGNVEYRKGIFPYRGNGRALALGEPDGKIKMLAHARTDRILGVHILGARAGDLINEAAVAIAFGASSEDLARTCHAHPTLGEALRESALAVDKRAIHF